MKIINALGVTIFLLIVLLVVINYELLKQGTYHSSIISSTDKRLRIKSNEFISDSLALLSDSSGFNSLPNISHTSGLLKRNEQSSSQEVIPNNLGFFTKLGFSIIFCFSALYIILSNKYDPETKKWAISVLTLIAGVWIGTATK